MFVFTITQVTTLLTNRTGWGRLGQAMLCLALIWWAWSAFVWAANAQAEDSGRLRACLLVATVLIFICGLALPQAFGAEGLLFAGSYTIVRLLHLAIYVDASRRGNASMAAIAGFRRHRAGRNGAADHRRGGPARLGPGPGLDAGGRDRLRRTRLADP